ncbi:hypothetical protein FDP41_003029 [Naegleria fowleri]|uniref:Uncharacterized protein n=1 Tax=Naegleria fowleri TaxID=5763 RepID=A0A6A5BL24_NAEFO|nr:uncharacterized protein FDP41_003029 [Naegleria fowleri]KAF0977707.1 hypothetical protein FDP41_003029 [Naegleria fowleri]CAG4712569.1 unnamed protein product [Naegleria fowleri]
MVQPQPHHNNYEEHEGVANPRAEYLTEYQPSAYQTSKDHHENNICGLPRGINSHHDTVLNHHEKQLIISQFWDKFHQNIVEQARKKQ